jgi:hypothetical protein
MVCLRNISVDTLHKGDAGGGGGGGDYDDDDDDNNNILQKGFLKYYKTFRGKWHYMYHKP